MKGPCSKFAFDPQVVAAFVDAHAVYANLGSPPRRRHVVNGTPIHPHDARVIRRWRSGQLSGATRDAVITLLHHYDLSITGLNVWATKQGLEPVLRGQLELPLTTIQESHA